LVPNLAASRIANRLDLQGPAYTVDAACASSLVALDHAVRDLASGRCGTVIVGGVHHCHDITFWSVFSQLGALSTSGRIAPFSRHADGLLIGEGSGMVVLQPLDEALTAGRRVYGVVCGTGVAGDGRESSLLRPRVGGQLLAVRRGWDAAGMNPDEAGLVEAHGTATAAGDSTELATVRAAFGDEGPELAMGSVKSMIGHCMPAAGIAGLIKATLALHHRVLPPTLHAEDPHPDLAGSRLVLPSEATDWRADRPRVAAVNAFGFGGINAHVVLREAEHPPAETAFATAPPDQAAEASATAVEPDATATLAADGSTVLCVAGPSASEVLAFLESVEPDTAVHRLDPGPVRVLILNPDERRLNLARRALSSGKDWRGRSDVWVVHDGLIDGGGSVVWMYPGVEPTFAPQIAGVAQHFGLPLPDLYLDLGDPEALGFQGAAIVHLGRFLTEVMGRLGHSGDHMAGHSVGEWTAMATSGLIPPDEMERLLIDIDPADLDVPGVQFVVLGCGAETAVELASGLPEVSLSHDNCPHQAILCGPEADVAEVVERARSHRVMAQVLPFTSGFHSPAFEPYLAQVSRHLDHLEVAAPHVPLWSATSLTPYPSAPDAVRRLAKDHLVETVRFRTLVETLYDAGARVFVQLGVGSLPSFVDDTLKGRAHVAVSAASEKRPGLEQLVRLTGSLWAEGADITPGLLGLGAVPAPVASEEAPATDDHTGTATGGGLLSLGAPLVRLPEDLLAAVRADLGALQRPDRAADAAAGVGRNGSGPTVDPVLARMQALADEATIASREVVDAFEAAPGPRSPGRIRRGGGSESPGGEAGADPADPGVRTVEVSLDTMPHLVDHCFYRQPADGIGSDVEEQFPVVPMTEMIEMMRQAALDRFPGRVAYAVGDVRALRWLTAAPPTDVTVVVGDLVADGDEAGGRGGAVGRVKVSLEGYARGTVHLADRYPVPDDLDPTGDAPGAPVTPTIKIDDVYGRRMMFHGPAYQGITALTDLTTSTISGEVAVLERTGAMLDSAGQLLGLWVMQCLAHDVIILPQSIERVEYFRDRPVGPMTCTVRMTDVNPQSVAADLELIDAEGPWCRITSWVDRRFNSDDVLWPFLRFPDERTVAQRQRSGWWLLLERWTDSASRELMVRRYTDADERTDYSARNPLAQRSWLLGRAVAKDAVRQHLWAMGAPPMYPVEVQVGHDDAGAPHVSAPTEATGLHLSIAHSAHVGVARLSTEGPVGIDVEQVKPRGEGFSALAFTDAERRILARASDQQPGDPVAANDDDPDFDVRLTAMWAAKEAAAKAAGTGLQGRPGDWMITEAVGDRIRVNDTWVEVEVLDIAPPGGNPNRTERIEPDTYVVAWTAGPQVPAADHPHDRPSQRPGALT
ncbi:MAG: polyketide synthase dehydratase domain-containing protein, partial [Microthrixaceae bacterium]|nr:polyketide synthase dehydratase domain-containing protein [Microthrixaceae bacterium]